MSSAERLLQNWSETCRDLVLHANCAQKHILTLKTNKIYDHPPAGRTPSWFLLGVGEKTCNTIWFSDVVCWQSQNIILLTKSDLIPAGKARNCAEFCRLLLDGKLSEVSRIWSVLLQWNCEHSVSKTKLYKLSSCSGKAKIWVLKLVKLLKENSVQ